ncbi:MAG: Rrf2 family transcriptional regulator [Acidimicrobiia bacterium]|nr:Rrf2 family transcriptional regulator [Acidimicrobiia bacterium]
MRLELNKRTELALRALEVLASSPSRVKGADLAGRIDSTVAFVPQVVAPLVGRGWVSSEPGPLGGYELRTPLDEVAVLELIEVMEGPTDTGTCVLKGRECAADEPCALHEPWTRARAALMAELTATSIDDIHGSSTTRRTRT